MDSVHCTLHTAHCTLYTAHYIRHTAPYTLHPTTPYYMLNQTLQNTHCKLHTANCPRHTAHCTLHTAHCTLHAPQYILHTILYHMVPIGPILWSPAYHFILHTTPHTTQYTLHTEHLKLKYVHWKIQATLCQVNCSSIVVWRHSCDSTGPLCNGNKPLLLVVFSLQTVVSRISRMITCKMCILYCVL